MAPDMAVTRISRFLPLADSAMRLLMAVGACTVSGFITGSLLGAYWLHVLSAVLFAITIMLATATIVFGGSTEWMVKLVGRCLGLEPVEMLDFTKRRRLSLALALPDGGYTAPYCPVFGLGTVRLLDCGLVDPDCTCSHMYLWRPLDQGERVRLSLASDHWQSWDAWEGLDHQAMIRRREQVLYGRSRL